MIKRKQAEIGGRELDTLLKICDEVENQIMPKKEVEAYMHILGFRFIGQYKQFRVYGNCYERTSYREISEDKYQIYNKYTVEKFVRPTNINEFK